MALALNTNVSSMNAQNSLTATNLNLSRSLERLSTGLKVNRGADGPAALVISEKMRAQIFSLRSALDNTNKAVSLVQVGEGALNEINALLNKARSLALDSANEGVNDVASRAANQAELDNLINSIDNIASRTKFNGTSLLDGTNTTLTFQIGIGTDDTDKATLNLSSMKADALGAGIDEDNLGDVFLTDLKTGGDNELSDADAARAALDVIDKAIDQVSKLRGDMGAFQANNLESNANTLRNTLENLTSAESVIRDTDFAQEIATFTKLQTQMQAGATVLGNANQMTALVAQLLRG